MGRQRTCGGDENAPCCSSTASACPKRCRRATGVIMFSFRAPPTPPRVTVSQVACALVSTEYRAACRRPDRRGRRRTDTGEPDARRVAYPVDRPRYQPQRLPGQLGAQGPVLSDLDRSRRERLPDLHLPHRHAPDSGRTTTPVTRRASAAVHGAARRCGASTSTSTPRISRARCRSADSRTPGSPATTWTGSHGSRRQIARGTEGPRRKSRRVISLEVHARGTPYVIKAGSPEREIKLSHTSRVLSVSVRKAWQLTPTGARVAGAVFVGRVASALTQAEALSSHRNKLFHLYFKSIISGQRQLL